MSTRVEPCPPSISHQSTDSPIVAVPIEERGHGWTFISDVIAGAKFAKGIKQAT